MSSTVAITESAPGNFEDFHSTASNAASIGPAVSNAVDACDGGKTGSLPNAAGPAQLHAIPG